MMRGLTINAYRALILILMVSVGVANAQQITAPASQEAKLTESEARAGQNFHSSFASAEFAAEGDVIVKGAPYSAVAIKKTTQILSDGRRAVRWMKASIYRDSEGRTRHEWWNDRKEAGRAAAPIIFDAVSGETYFLYSRVGRSKRLPSQRGIGWQPKIITPQSPPDNIAYVVGETIERLGTKKIEGLMAEGVRVTSTISASEMVDGKPAKAVYERWYSQELRRNLMITSSDPRFGEALFQLTNIDRREPEHELFVIPVEFESDSAIARGKEQLVSVKLEPGDKIAVDNRTTGRIVVTGWDRDVVEARATSARGTEIVNYVVGRGSPGKSVWLKADYAEPEPDEVSSPESKSTPPSRPPAEPKEVAPLLGAQPDVPAIVSRPIRLPGATGNEGVIEPPSRDGRPIEVHLEVRVPRYVEIDVIKVIRSGVEITGVQTPLNIFGDKSDIVLRNVGVAEVHTRDGAIDIENVSGFVDVISTSGPIRVRNAGADIRAFSISGDVTVQCVRGRVNVDSTNGAVSVINVQGDVDANTSSSNVLFSGRIRADGRYHLKSMSGSVEFALQENPTGFTAALSSYRGVIENEFQLANQQASQHEENVNRRIIGRYGDGQAQISLDTFDGRVKLGRSAIDAAKECK